METRKVAIPVHPVTRMPMQIKLMMRWSDVVQGRLKVALVAPHPDDPAQYGALGPEFRLEMG